MKKQICSTTTHKWSGLSLSTTPTRLPDCRIRSRLLKSTAGKTEIQSHLSPAPGTAAACTTTGSESSCLNPQWGEDVTRMCRGRSTGSIPHLSDNLPPGFIQNSKLKSEPSVTRTCSRNSRDSRKWAVNYRKGLRKRREAVERVLFSVEFWTKYGWSSVSAKDITWLSRSFLLQ